MKFLIPWIAVWIAVWITVWAAIAVASIGVGLYAMERKHTKVQEFTAKLFTVAASGILLGTLALLCWR